MSSMSSGSREAEVLAAFSSTGQAVASGISWEVMSMALEILLVTSHRLLALASAVAADVAGDVVAGDAGDEKKLD